MDLLRDLMRLQHERGYLDDHVLRTLAAQRRLPLYELEGLVSFYPSFRRTPPPRVSLHVCRDLACAMAGGNAAHRELIERLGDRTDVEVQEVSCLGRCDSAPAVAVNDRPAAPWTLKDLERLLGWVEDPAALDAIEQEPVRRTWRCDPYSDPATRYTTVRSLVTSADDLGSMCLQQLNDSGLRGMGGAGFPTGRKWDLVRQQQADTKYVICNADESEPGTFKDRLILEELPHLVIEGMLMAGLTVGAHSGIIYLRHEYGREQRALEAALDEARQAGVLGSNAADSGQPFDIQIFVSPGGYILGEETALLEALEDKRGEPRNKPPYPGSVGLWGQPTLINNVETFALTTAIMHHGSTWWHAQGRDKFSGLTFVSISGDIRQAGVYEIPFGTTVAELIELAGGMQDGQTLKAFLPGGASSNFLPADRADTPLDFDAVKQAGSMLGTAAVVVIGQNRNLLTLATNVVRFFRNESCGKCVPCRLGSQQAVQTLEGVQAGTRSPQELASLADLAETLEQTSICGLGQVVLNPIVSMLKHFPDEVPA